MSTATLDRISRYAGWAAYLSGAIAFVSGVFLSLFYLYTLAPSAPGATSSIDFGILNDIVGLFGTILMLPVPVALYWLTRRQGPALGLIALALGLVGMLAIIVGQTLLIKDVISFDTSLPFSLIGLALMGVWLILANYLGGAGGVLARWLAWLGGLTGAALFLAVGLVLLSNPFAALADAATLSGGALDQQPPALVGAIIALAILGGGAYLLGFPIWLIGIGRRLLAAPSAAEQGVEWRAQPNAR
jgi:hypothetical protein